MRGASHRRRLIAALAAAVAALCQADAAAQTPEDAVVHSGAIPSATTMALAPDGRIFVAEQGGRLRVISDGALLPDPFLTVPATSSAERGLLGVAFDPDFASNRWVYVYYTAASPVANRVSRFTASAANPDVAEPGSERVIFDGIPSQSGYHNGGAIHFGPDGKLYVAVGENHAAGDAQSTGSLAGKLLRIDRDGSIPHDNPFYETATGANRSIWALGLRNPFTFDIQPATGRILVNDVGQNAYEEINEAWTGPPGGLNFGWPATEGPTTDPRFQTPFHAYAHAGGHCAITGGAFYDPATVNFPPELVGDYFFADFCQGWIKGIDLATGRVSMLLGPSGSRSPVDIDVGDDGSLYYLARGQGNVHRVRYAGAPTAPATTQPVPVPVGGDATSTVAAGGSEPLALALRAPARARWRRAVRRGIPVRVSAPAGTRVRVALRRGKRRLAVRRVTIGAAGTKRVRLRLRRPPRARRVRLRIEASAVAADGRRSRVSRRIVLRRPRAPGRRADASACVRPRAPGKGVTCRYVRGTACRDARRSGCAPPSSWSAGR